MKLSLKKRLKKEMFSLVYKNKTLYWDNWDSKWHIFIVRKSGKFHERMEFPNFKKAFKSFKSNEGMHKELCF